MMNNEATIQQQMPGLSDLRRRLHQIPELGYEEFKTAQVIRAELDRRKIPHIDGVAGAPTATIAWLGDSSKPCIALRADIDALPIVEKTGLPYASTHPGRMHACGHDGHITTLLGAAGLLQGLQGELPVCVKLIFQPAEEGGGGAGRLVEAGVLDGRIGPRVDAIFGLHCWPGLNLGIVATKAGALLAATDNFEITFVGQGCHGGYPHTGTDPIVTACEAVLNLQQFVSRELDPTEPGVITVGQIRAGSAVNIIPDTATFSGTARTLSPQARAQLKAAMQRRCAGIAAANNCRLEFRWTEGYPPTVNDPAMADYVAKVAKATVGEERYLPLLRPSMGGEDFAYYLEKVPGCFFLVGVQPRDCEQYPCLHNDRFDFTDDALATGMRMFVGLVMKWKATK